MRNPAARLIVLGLVAALALPATAAGLPSVTFHVRVRPIPVNPSQAHGRTYQHTGRIRGAGAVIEAAYTDHGTEYFGGPPPLKWIALHLPAGTTVHRRGFASCSRKLIEGGEYERCPKQSIASPTGLLSSTTQYGNSRIEETAALQAYFTGNSLTFLGPWKRFMGGIYLNGNLTSGSTRSGPTLTLDIPPPTANLPNWIEAITTDIGAAAKHGHQLISYITLPKTCPSGGLTFTADLTFGTTQGPSGETVPVTTSVPCSAGK